MVKVDLKIIIFDSLAIFVKKSRFEIFVKLLKRYFDNFVSNFELKFNLKNKFKNQFFKP